MMAPTLSCLSGDSVHTISSLFSKKKETLNPKLNNFSLVNVGPTTATPAWVSSASPHNCVPPLRPNTLDFGQFDQWPELVLTTCLLGGVGVGHGGCWFTCGCRTAPSRTRTPRRTDRPPLRRTDRPPPPDPPPRGLFVECCPRCKPKEFHKETSREREREKKKRERKWAGKRKKAKFWAPYPVMGPFGPPPLLPTFSSCVFSVFLGCSRLFLGCWVVLGCSRVFLADTSNKPK